MKWIIDEQYDGMIIREYLQKIHGFSRRILTAVKLERKNIQVNGVEKNVRYALSAGDVLEIRFPKEKVSAALKSEKIDLDIVYEDEEVIVINKPPGMATMPSPQHVTGTLANGLIAYYRSCGRNDSTVHVVTRLDANTSGLVLIAKDRYTHSLFSEAQKAAKINRKYMAVVEGDLQAKGTIDAPIARKAGSIIEREVNDSGRRAVTHYKKLQELAGHSLVEIELETGRTHQIRVHFSNEGYPLAGDDLYGGTLQLMGRQALHCFDLSFRHPLTRRAVHLQVELPEDMKLLLQGIELKKNV